MGSPAGTAGSGSGISTVIRSAALTRWPGSRIVRAPIVTAPSRIRAFSRVRDSGVRAASTRSSRAPALSPATRIVSQLGLRAAMNRTEGLTEPDEKPLDPEQHRIVARVRWLMLISGFATVLGIAVVIGVIGYRFFRAEGSAAQADVAALLPKGARVVSTAVAEGRIVVTVEQGGAIELRMFDLKTLKPAGRLRFVS